MSEEDQRYRCKIHCFKVWGLRFTSSGFVIHLLQKGSPLSVVGLHGMRPRGHFG